MKFLIFDNYYDVFLSTLYRNQPNLKNESYKIQFHQIMDQCFGTADFYSENLKKLGHEGEDIIINCQPLQKSWAAEHGLKINTHKPLLKIRRRKGIPVPSLGFDKNWLRDVVLAQIKAVRPDVLYVQDSWSFHRMGLLEEVRPFVKFLVCQHASPLPPLESFKGFDLIVSSLPNQVAYFRSAGLKSEYLGIAFEASLIERIIVKPGLYDVVHVGGYAGIHKDRTEFLEKVSEKVKVDFWGYGVDKLPENSKIKANFHSQAWGRGMYEIRGSSKMTLTGHIGSVAGNYANNMTLYEATGIGSLLLTDKKKNLGELFEIGKEVIAYDSPQDCIEKIQYYLEHEDERAAIAANGQKRTLKEHTYFHRMRQLLDILKKYL